MQGKTLNQAMRAPPGFPVLMEETSVQMTKPRKAEVSAVVIHLVPFNVVYQRLFLFTSKADLYSS